ncbi:Polyamine oxidase [Stylophora pistillata]|uniref:Polyamine oxidase n=2 Tax=Stylophora pistillata TaxID=50429 RepID=A0A2B4RVH2_STYPI|nr:Polyamine oxidase [Stylophora pistillata]
MGWKSRQPIEKVLEYSRLDFEHARPPELVSFYQLLSRGNDFFVSDSKGLWSLYEDLYKPLEKHILLWETVEKISYTNDSVEVQTKSNKTFVADYVLCTFSSRVLASDALTFDPPLPEWKQEAIYKNPMSVYTKIFLKFPRKFWDDHEYILHASKRRGYFPILQDLERPGMLPNGSGILLITVTGDEGRRIEEKTDEETKAEVMTTLKKVYGEKIPNPSAIFYNRWSQDKFTQGSYSEPVVGTTSHDFINLGRRLGRLYFAGEATSEEWHGYMQGAYLSGKEKAQIIADTVNGVTVQTNNVLDDYAVVHEEL